MRQLVRIGAIATPRRLFFLVNNRRFFSSDPVRRTWSPAAAKAHFGVAVVPQQSAWVIERFGKFYTILTPGFHFLIPIVDRVAYLHSLKEEAISISNQTAITKDNVTIQIDGVIYVRVVDAYKASYGVSDAISALTLLAQTTMRSELGKLTLDRTFQERENLNHAIVKIINDAAQEWGIRCMRYEIRDIVPPSSIKQAMEMQAEAERQKRAQILQSEGDQASEINIAQGRREAQILKAQGEAQALRMKANATAKGIEELAKAISDSDAGPDAMSLRVAEEWVSAWRGLAKGSNTVVVPSNPGDAASMVAQAMSISRNMQEIQGSDESNAKKKDDAF